MFLWTRVSRLERRFRKLLEILRALRFELELMRQSDVARLAATEDAADKLQRVVQRRRKQLDRELELEEDEEEELEDDDDEFEGEDVLEFIEKRRARLPHDQSNGGEPT